MYSSTDGRTDRRQGIADHIVQQYDRLKIVIGDELRKTV